MANEILFTTQGLKTGVDKLANAVKSTLGAKGRNVIIDRPGENPQITKDGVTVARSIELRDNVENMGALLVKEVANKTADIAGDGTTTATVLAQAIIARGFKSLGAGANPMDLKRGIDKAVEVVVKQLKEYSKPVDNNDTVAQIAAVSANNDPAIGNLIAKAFGIVGMDGIIRVEQANGSETSITVVEGLQFNRGYASPFFVTDAAKEQCELIKPAIFLFDDKLNIMQPFLPILEQAVAGGRPVLIIAEEIEGEVLPTLVVNRMKGKITVCAVKSPDFGANRRNIMEDIAILTGGIFISETKGLKLDSFGTPAYPYSEMEKYFGKCEKVIIEKDKTIIIGGYGTEIENRCNELKMQIENTSNDIDKEKLKERLAKLKNGVAVINVGATTETEMGEKKDRIDDALCATRAAAEEGYIAGGGVTYIKCVSALHGLEGANEDETTGINIIKRILEEPFRAILNNAGIEPGEWIRDVRQKAYGFGMNVKTDTFEDLLKAGVIDPTKVARVALENAASIAGLFLTTDCVVSTLPREDAL